MSNRKTTIGLIILFIAFSALLAAFYASAYRARELAHGLTAEQPPDRTARPLYRVALIAQEADNPFWLEVERGARAAADRLGITLEYGGPSRIDAKEQTRLLAKAITSRADAVIVQGMNDSGYRGLIDEADRLGIKIVTVDADEPDSKRLAYVGTDNREAGRLMGSLVAEATGGSGQIGVLTGSGATNQQQRLLGLRDVTARYPNLHIADVRSTGNSRLRAVKQTEDMLSQYGGLSAIVGFSALDGPGMAEAIRRAGTTAGERSGRDIILFAFDDLPATRDAVARCSLRASIVQQPYEMGFQAVQLLWASGGESAVRSDQDEHFTNTKLLTRQSLGLEGGCQP